ncbi:MAG: TRAP transporter small permease [Planctomycetaceae bacterium]|nr:TRAP transporter small permease [Planctomycetaceae bacterium]
MLHTFKSTLEKLLITVTSIMLVVMVALAIQQVFSRYVLKAPAIYTEETLRFVMIWMGFLGSAYAFGLDQHLRLVFLTDRLRPRGRRILLTVNGLITIFFSMVILLIGGISMVKTGMDQVSPILNVKMGYVYTILPISAVLITLLQGVNLLLTWADAKDEPEAAGA